MALKNLLRICRRFLCLLLPGLLLPGLAAAETRAVIIAGLGGEADYEEEFQRHANRLGEALADVTEDVVLLTGEAATQTAVEGALDAMAGRSSSDDTLLFVFIGHGSYDGERFKFNVPGPDFSAAALGDWLDPIPSRTQLLVVTGAASGAVLDVLGAPERTLITGTRSGDQRNATVFGRYFTAALEDAAADVDKDGRVTAQEAFNFASDGVVRHYDQDGEMATENPVTSGPEPGMILARLDAAPTVNAADAHLIARRDELEQDIATLRAEKARFTQDEYFAQLQKLLLEMAMIESQLSSAGETP
ncbi:MAG: hypothetical protein AAGE43_00895 [Pseudomonadota bacterium]